MPETGIKMIRDKKEIKEPTKWRMLLDVLVSNAPSVQNIRIVNTDGDVHFSVDLESQGLDSSIFINYRQLLFSPFVANFIGELLVRENIEQFVPLLTAMNTRQYMDIVNRYEHNRFGMFVDKNELVLTFHVSLLQSILTEDFKRKVKHKA